MHRQEIKTHVESFRLLRWRQQVRIYCSILSFVLNWPKTVESRKYKQKFKKMVKSSSVNKIRRLKYFVG